MKLFGKKEEKKAEEKKKVKQTESKGGKKGAYVKQTTGKQKVSQPTSPKTETSGKVDSEKVNELLKQGWIKAWMLFDVQAPASDVTQEALKKHLQRLKGFVEVKIIKDNITSISEVDPPAPFKAQGIEKMYSQLAEVLILVKSFEGLVNVTINFAPTAVEILAPEKITLDMRDAQNSLASIADMMHKYASAGLGGVVVSR